MRRLLMREIIMAHVVIFEKEKSSSDFQTAKHSRPVPAATRAKAARQGNGCETAVLRGANRQRTRRSSGNASAVNRRTTNGLTAELIRFYSAIHSDSGDAQKLMTPLGRWAPSVAISTGAPSLRARPSLYPREGPPTRFQSRSCRNGLEDLRRRRTRRRQISGRAAAEPRMASLRPECNDG